MFEPLYMSESHTAASTAQQAWGEQSDIEWARIYVEKNVGHGEWSGWDEIETCRGLQLL